MGRRRLWLAALLAACAVGGSLGAQQAPQVPGRGDYVIGPQDVVAITVLGSPELSGKFGVNSDGTLTFPQLGRIQAAGLTVTALERELVRRLLADKILVGSPQVTVTLEQAGSRRFFVMGEVRQTGLFAMVDDVSLVEALARAGFAGPQAGRELLVIRNPSSSTRTATNGQPMREVFDLRDLESGKLSNVMIRNGDFLVLPRADEAYVYGHVRNNGAFPIQKGMTVLQLLAVAGGVTDRGATNRIHIVRQVNGKYDEIRVNSQMTDIVLPGDVVIVPERFM
jgi:polysaccharide export outer membrane protein